MAAAFVMTCSRTSEGTTANTLHDSLQYARSYAMYTVESVAIIELQFAHTQSVFETDLGLGVPSDASKSVATFKSILSHKLFTIARHTLIYPLDNNNM